jgi:hypothetical protein
MLFKVEPGKSVRELNPELSSIKEFDKIPERNLEFIFLVYDYESPYRKLPLDQRKEKVAFNVGFKMEKGRRILDKNARNIINGKNAPTQKALIAFKELIYDSDRDTYQSLEDLIANIREELRTPSRGSQDMKHKAALAKDLPALAQTKKQLAQILEIKDTSENESEDDEENKMSTLEMANEGLI